MKKNPHENPRARNLIECFEEIPDPRVERTRKHPLINILFIGLCSMLTGGENFTDMADFGRARRKWLEKFLDLSNGIPSHDTFNRVFCAIDPEQFLTCFVRWVQGLCPVLEGEVVSIDGKALRRALDEGQPLAYIVSAWACENGLVLGQVKVDEKSNEITAIPELLRVLELAGAIVTLDAIGCQKHIAAEIIAAKADYVLALKANHSTVYEEVKAYFDHALGPAQPHDAPEALDTHQSIDKGHGRIETRRYWHTEDIGWFEDKARWKGLRSIGMVESIREINGQRSVERRYYLSSLARDAQTFARAVRGHWGVENNLHWTLDVVFNEDQSRARTKNAAQNVAALRRLSLNLLKKAKPKNLSIRRLRRHAALSDDYLEQILGIHGDLDA